MPAPAGAITVLLPLYVNGLGFFDVRAFPLVIALYTLCMAFLLVSTIPTYSGKLLGERIERELVLPILIGVAALVGLLVTYPYGTLTVVTLLYLAVIPLSYRRFGHDKRAWEASAGPPAHADGTAVITSPPPGETRH
jgi:CDP-diacylglycerol--serine O-phosphatidyltransferase